MGGNAVRPSMLENSIIALGEQNEHAFMIHEIFRDETNFVGSKVVYILYWATMH